MAKQLSRPAAIKEYLNLGASSPVSAGELMTFIKACSAEEKEEYAKIACCELTRLTGEEHLL
jgi:hypothetical protein